MIPSLNARQKDNAILMLHAAKDAHDTVTQSKSEMLRSILINMLVSCVDTLTA